MTRGRVLLLIAVLAATWVVIAWLTRADVHRTDGEAIVVAAAADLQFAFAEIGRVFEQESGRRVVLVFGSTGSLATQIENGARVDVFAAANVQFVDDLRAKGLVIGNTQQLYGVGRIALVSNKKSGLSLRDVRDLTRSEVRKVAIANPDHAPYGTAARQALEAAGVWEQVKPKLVYGETVRQALQYIQTGNADAGIVSLSLANVPEIGYVLVDQELHQPLRQAVAVVSSTKQEQAGRAFIAFINGPTGRAIMNKYGFLLPEESLSPASSGR